MRVTIIGVSTNNVLVGALATLLAIEGKNGDDIEIVTEPNIPIILKPTKLPSLEGVVMRDIPDMRGVIPVKYKSRHDYKGKGRRIRGK